jgi:hypothetical protein
MIFLLQLVALNASPVWHSPFHRAGTGPYPLSLKLRDSGHMPAKLGYYYWPSQVVFFLVAPYFLEYVRTNLADCSLVAPY